MQLGLIIIIILALLAAKGFYDKKRAGDKLLADIRKHYGKVPSREYTPEKLEALSFYHKSRQKDADIDDITWQDLDMDTVYMLLNSTFSCIGEEYMYHLLRSPVYDPEILKERERLISHYYSDPAAREEMSLLLSRIGLMKKISVYEYMNRLREVRPDSTFLHVLQALLLICSIAYIFVDPAIGIVLTCLIFFVNVVTYLKRKAAIENYFSVVSAIIRIVDFAKDTASKVKDPEISSYTEALDRCADSFRSMRNGSFVLVPAGASADLLQSLLDYVRMAFHIDLIKFNSMLKVFTDRSAEFEELFEIIGSLDCALALASYRAGEPVWCQPQLLLVKPGQDDLCPFIEAKGLAHPLLDDPVRNDIIADRSALITGSNASGKSTFIKALAVNALLAQTVHTVLAESYRGSYFRIMTSMALRDSLLGGESYYIVEIKSLKRILNHANGDIPLLCFIDEVLKGTNTLERIAASSMILRSLAEGFSLSFAATHDIELTYILEKIYANYHFEEQVEDNKVLFDYRLHSGRAVSRNAIKLLGMLGFPDEMIEQSNAMAEEYLQKGEWRCLQ